jgi:hypothetical protein
MSWVSIVDAWCDDITGNVVGMTDAIVHKYAPWSLEQLFPEGTGKHLAVWPEAEAETMEAFDTSGGQLAAQEFVVTVWEKAEAAQRLIDVDESNAAWLDLHELIRARFFVARDIQLGNPHIMRTRIVSGSFPTVGGLRVMELHFLVKIPYSMA